MADKWKSCGGIWQRKTRKGNDMLSIMIGETPYIAFKNTRKQEGTKNPDWQIFQSRPMEEKPKEDEPPF